MLEISVHFAHKIKVGVFSVKKESQGHFFWLETYFRTNCQIYAPEYSLDKR